MKRILAQTQKEIRQFRRDKLTVALAFVLPTLTLLILGYAIRLEEKDIPITVQDFDNSPLSRGLTERLFATDQLNPVSFSGHEVIRNAIDTGLAEAAVIIPPEFSRKFKAGLPSPIEVLIDGTDVNNARVIKNSILATCGFFQDTLKYGTKPRLIQAETRLWFNPGRKESLYVVPGTLGLILWIYPSLLAALAFVREKEQGTILQVYASSISALELLAGKTLAYLIIGLLEAGLIIGLASIFFSLRFAGDPIPFLLGSVLFILDSVLFGIMIAAGVNTQSAAVQGVAFGGFTTALLLSGFLYPLRNIQFPFNYVSYLVPARYYNILARDAFVRGSGWANVWYIPILLIIFMFIYLFICRKRIGTMQVKS